MSVETPTADVEGAEVEGADVEGAAERFLFWTNLYRLNWRFVPNCRFIFARFDLLRWNDDMVGIICVKTDWKDQPPVAAAMTLHCVLQFFNKGPPSKPHYFNSLLLADCTVLPIISLLKITKTFLKTKTICLSLKVHLYNFLGTIN